MRLAPLLDRFGEALAAQNGGWYCHYCYKRVFRSVKPTKHYKATVDHKIPKARGGRTTLQNLALCCFECNQRKGSRSYLDYFRETAEIRSIRRARL